LLPISFEKFSDPTPILGLKQPILFFENFSPFLISLMAKIDLLNFNELISFFLGPIIGFHKEE